MHELSLAISIVEQVVEAAKINNAEKIISIRILIGPLSGIMPESLLFCFEEACYGSISEGARLIIENAPILIFCPRCEKENEVAPHNLHCPKCNFFNTKILSGKEFQIIDLEVI